MSYVDPFRLRVKKAITAALKTIAPANGYVNDLSDIEATVNGETVLTLRVTRGRTVFNEQDPLPMVAINEHPRALEPDEPDAANATDQFTQWDVLIQGWAKDDPVNPTDSADILVAEVIKCLAGEKSRPAVDGSYQPNILGMGRTLPCVWKLTIGSPVVRPADGVVSDQAMFWLTITLTLVEDVEKPFD